MKSDILKSICLFLISISFFQSETLAQEKEWGDTSTSEPHTEARAEWFEKTKGENLALGREVWFSKKPNWSYTTRKDDPLKLTTGKLSEREDDRLLWAKDAVGWRDSGPILMLVDLGEKQPVGRVAARFLGGSEYPMFAFPKAIEVVASDDGKTFYRLSRLAKLLPGEKDLSDWKQTYYLPEDQKTYVHTFTFDVDVKAKVIGLNVELPGTFLVTDQLAVLRGSNPHPPQPSEVPGAVRFEAHTDTLAFIPRKKELVVTTNLVTPTWLTLVENRPENKRTPFASLVFELPKEIELLEGSIGKIEPPREGENVETLRWTVSNLDVRKQNNGMTGYGPFYLKLREGSAWPDNAKAVLITKDGDRETCRVEAALRPVEVPAAGEFKNASISLGWMTEPFAMAWPGFLKNYRALGFNTLPTFPRNYAKGKTGDSYYREYPESEKLAFIEQARQSGFRILYNESPFHVLVGNKAKSNPEILNQVHGKPGRHLSPVYRGELYREEIRRVGDLVAKVRPDIIFWDIELWHASVEEARTTREFRRALALSQKGEPDMLADLGVETLADLRKEVHARAAAAEIPPPPIGLYNNHPGIPVYGYLYEWNRIYPDTVDFAMPSLYVQGNVARVRETIRINRKALGSNRIIPWLTTGTYGEFESFLVEPMILETFLNGVEGITYYSFFDFDPEDFYYHAKALALLHPYQDLLANGTPESWDSGNDAVAASLLKNDREALLLLSNYGSTRPLQAQVKPVFSPEGKIRDTVSGEILKEADIQALSVPGQGFRLLHFTNKNDE